MSVSHPTLIIGINYLRLFCEAAYFSKLYRQIEQPTPYSEALTLVVDVARVEETRNAYRTLVGKPEGKRPLGKPKHRWVDNIKMDLREIGWDGIDLIDLAQDRDQWRTLVNTVMNLRVP
jgi:hypothetical protein